MRRIKAAIKRFIINTIIEDIQANGELRRAVEANREISHTLERTGIDVETALRNPSEAVSLFFRIPGEGSKGAQV
jgi:hypothetical protein